MLVEEVQEVEGLLVDGALAGVHQEVEVDSEIVAEVEAVADHSLVVGEDQGEVLVREEVASEEGVESIFYLHAFHGVWHMKKCKTIPAARTSSHHTLSKRTASICCINGVLLILHQIYCWKVLIEVWRRMAT